MQQEKFGFVYIWYDRYRRMYYIGSHWGTEEDGYICSSNRMRDAYRRRPDDFKRRILTKCYTNRKDLFLLEEQWLQKINENEIKTKYYNFRKTTLYLCADETTRKTSIEKMRESLKKRAAAMTLEERKEEYGGKWRGKPSPFKNRKHSEESKKLIKEKRKLQIITDETKKKMSGRIPWNKGKNLRQLGYIIKSGWSKGKKLKPRSEETKQKISIKNSINTKLLWENEEYRNHMINAHKNKKCQENV